MDSLSETWPSGQQGREFPLRPSGREPQACGSCNSLLQIPPDMTEAEAREAAVRHWANSHRSRGNPVTAKQLARLQDLQVARITRTYLRHYRSNYSELIDGRPNSEVHAIRARVNRAICRRFPGLKPPEWD